MDKLDQPIQCFQLAKIFGLVWIFRPADSFQHAGPAP